MFEAQHELMGKTVAIRLLRSPWSTDLAFERRFVDSARAAAPIRHENLAELQDIGRDGAVGSYLVLERVEGESLAALLAREGPLSLTAVVDILAPVLSALAAAHERGIAHREVRPENIMLIAAPPDGVRHVKLLDLGVARLETAAEMLPVSPYRAPEQDGGAGVDGRTDLYAVGVVLYQALTGRVPVGQQPAPPSTLRSGLPQVIDTILVRALSPFEARWSSALEMRQVLEEAAALPLFERGPAPPSEVAPAPPLPAGTLMMFQGGGASEAPPVQMVAPVAVPIAATLPSAQTYASAAPLISEPLAGPRYGMGVAMAARVAEAPRHAELAHDPAHDHPHTAAEAEFWSNEATPGVGHPMHDEASDIWETPPNRKGPIIALSVALGLGLFLGLAYMVAGHAGSTQTTEPAAPGAVANPAHPAAPAPATTPQAVPVPAAPLPAVPASAPAEAPVATAAPAQAATPAHPVQMAPAPVGHEATSEGAKPKLLPSLPKVAAPTPKPPTPVAKPATVAKPALVAKPAQSAPSRTAARRKPAPERETPKPSVKTESKPQRKIITDNPY